MTLSIWRYAHLALAILSTAFLLLLASTGAILSYDAIEERSANYRVDNFENITLAEVLPTLRDSYFEVLELRVDHNGFVSIDASDEDGASVKSYIDPLSGKKIGELKPKSKFINWITALHRSLFLKETGRAIIGVVSFILFLIATSGFVLIIKRQKGIRHFFNKINKDFLSQYFHVVSGRILLIPILMIAATGTLLFLVRMDYFEKEPIKIEHQQKETGDTKELADIPFFKNTKLADVERVEFPFIPDDEEEPFVIHLRDRAVTVNQVSGEIMAEAKLPYAVVLEKINMDLHTGRTSIVWAAILGIASLNILLFIYSGFAIMFRRTKTKIKNKFKAKDAEIIILVGSENGSTLFFANHIHQQLLSLQKKSFLAQMNDFEAFPNAKELVILTSTFGLGDPPTNATQFEKLLQKFPLTHEIGYSVVGFGSKSYEEFCAFAKKVDELLAQQPNAKRTASLFTVNDRSAEDFVKWTHEWSAKTLIPLATAPTVYNTKVPNLKTFVVTDKTIVTTDNSTFKIVLKPKYKQKFQSGDLLAVYPANDNRERFYSVGRVSNEVQLIVKFYEGGLGSEYLNAMKIGDEMKARIMENPKFHLPKHSTEIAMISNGTGIAPFLGMVQENDVQRSIKMYCGFRYDNMLTEKYRNFAKRQTEKGKLESIQFAFSKEEPQQYVMDLIKKEESYFANLLQNGGIIMICGALRMQKDVEKLLEEITQKNFQKQLCEFQNQILTDCY